ncbi:MAG TPA: hypothetical protein VE911_02785 [Candidatus Nitrosopolaris sp.]|nr:hypothetical protein [Candidatus Nitrosopolaris sp.]
MAQCRALAVVCLGCCLATACTFTVGHLALATTRPVDLTEVAAAPRLRQHATGRDCIPIVLVAPTRFPDLAHAIDEALRSGGGTIMTDVVVRYSLTYLLLGRGCYIVEGDVS